MHDLMRDVRVAVRSLRRRPGFSAVATLTTGLALGGVVAIFAVVKGVLLDPLPYPEADRLVTLDVTSRQGYGISASIPNYESWGEAQSFDRYGASAGTGLTLTGDGPAEVLSGQMVLGDMFGLLGAEAHRGRLFGPGQTEPGSPAVVVLGHRFWTDRFAANDRVLGQTLVLDGRPHEVIGVLPPDWSFPRPGTAAYIPMGSVPGLPWDDRESSFGTRIYARLAPAATLSSAHQQLEAINRGVTQEVGLENASADLRPLKELAVGDLNSALWILMGAVAFVLLIATANIANLTLARGEGRRQEIATRTALGAGRGEIVRGLVTESVLLSLAGGVVGVIVAWAGLRALMPMLPEITVTAGDRIALDAPLFGFAFLAALGSGLLFGLVPALRVSRTNLSDDLKDGSRSVAVGNTALRKALVVSEVALAMVLLVGAGLMLRSLQELRTVDKGFEAEGILTARIAVNRDRFDTSETWTGFLDRVEEGAGALPGVRQAALTLLVPLGNRSWERRILAEGQPLIETEGESFLFGMVSGAYFETLGVPLVEGRTFAASDVESSTPVTIIDETMAELYWPGESAIGKRVVFEFEGDAEAPVPLYRTVIGVASNVRHYELESASRIQAYIPLSQPGRSFGTDMSILLRTDGPPEQLAGPLRALVAQLDPATPVSELRTMRDYVDNAVRGPETLGRILTTFSGLALLLAGIGIFGVLSYSVLQRRAEIGIRMAMGADARHVRRWIAREGLALAGAGVVIGLVAAVLLTRLLRGFLFEVAPIDPLVYGGLAVFLLLISLGATLLPARSATRVDPARVLRPTR